MVLAGIHSLEVLDTGMRRYDGCVVRVSAVKYQVLPSRFWSYNPFCVVEHWKLRADKREDCLSAASSAAPALSLSAQSSRRPTWQRGLSFGPFIFGHSKKRVSPYRAKNKVKPNCRLKKSLAHKGRNPQPCTSTKNKIEI